MVGKWFVVATFFVFILLDRDANVVNGVLLNDWNNGNVFLKFSNGWCWCGVNWGHIIFGAGPIVTFEFEN